MIKAKKSPQYIHASAPKEIVVGKNKYRLCRTITGDPLHERSIREQVGKIQRDAREIGKVVIARYSRLGGKLWFEARLYWRWRKSS